VFYFNGHVYHLVTVTVGASRARVVPPISANLCASLRSGNSRRIGQGRLPMPSGQRKAPPELGYLGRYGAPGKARTCNLRVRSAMLYPLSYGRRLVSFHREERPRSRSMVWARIRRVSDRAAAIYFGESFSFSVTLSWRPDADDHRPPQALTARQRHRTALQLEPSRKDGLAR
jgi:hypothetical protein